jgi:glycosyltransferase involved in cell wall biosynthesis
VLRLCQELIALGVDLHVATTDANGPDKLDVPLDREVEVEGVPVRYFARDGSHGFTVSSALARSLCRTVSAFDLVHVTAAFNFPSTAACIAARHARVPYVVSPRGSCLPYALTQKRHKKVPYWWLFERRNLRAARALHATSELEADALRALFPSQDIWLVPNGVDLPSEAPRVERKPSRVLFLGRIHPDKAIDRLLRAASLCTARIPSLEVLVAGPDDVGEWARLQALLTQLEPRPVMRYLGPVHGRAKSELLASANVLVLPSHGTENFGQVVLEALAHGTPVIASKHTPWGVLEASGAGRWVSNEPSELAEALASMLGAPERAQARSRAALELARRYAWKGLASDLLARYEEAVWGGSGGGAR